MLLEVLILPFFAVVLAYGQFTSGVDLVEVYATVSDAHGSPVTGLAAPDFTVSDQGVPQTISAFAAGGVRVALAIAIDRSFSMRSTRLDRFALVKHAAERLVAGLQPADVVSVVAVGSDVEVVARPSSSVEVATNAIRSLA